ncbi:hypothetical protein [Aminobacter ciceronei]|uniref:Uncharacterized protein n=1 Tax=Aminobacter ciceronei TaxID=150723 RepID=A0ABR6CGM0_9HYPH|nr:hypothetical protein [Aminobacter ciceronei]MBA8909928.1 hypothetical protein [Aminobacter ciceronei]MBA9023700.1 hypothetical protein [Aminobacter ciceronei]
MYEEAWIAFNLTRIVTIIVDSMPVESQRRVPEQESCRRIDTKVVLSYGHINSQLIRRSVAQSLFRKNYVLALTDRNSAICRDLMLDGHKD